MPLALQEASMILIPIIILVLVMVLGPTPEERSEAIYNKIIKDKEEGD